uniref:Uncharacterized protein n=1 Tax=Medicago truncatula TaxID=3880 RepID=B7FGG1_MEDTR|nr:unknown [Medicago truncatula]AFK40783.1 unknown [Medicago truncatula]
MSDANSLPRNSGYLDALSQAIHKKLQRALANSSQRRNLLQELFADVALEVALSMVLAILLLELCDFLRSYNLLLLTQVDIFYVGKGFQTKNTIDVRPYVSRVLCTCIEPESSLANQLECLAS